MCQRLYNLENLLESYSYKGVLERGFAVVRESNGSLVTRAEMLSKGESISLSFKEDGYAEAIISFVEVTSAKSLQPNKVLKKKLVKEKNKSKDDIQGSLL
jgi:exodeoxyribonuclease VII large subunit